MLLLQLRIREKAARMEDQSKACVSLRCEILQMEQELLLKRQEVVSARAEVTAECSAGACER